MYSSLTGTVELVYWRRLLVIALQNVPNFRCPWTVNEQTEPYINCSSDDGLFKIVVCQENSLWKGKYCARTHDTRSPRWMKLQIKPPLGIITGPAPLERWVLSAHCEYTIVTSIFMKLRREQRTHAPTTPPSNGVQTRSQGWPEFPLLCSMLLCCYTLYVILLCDLPDLLVVVLL